MKELCPELSEVMDTMIKTHPLKSRLFAELCEEMGAQYQLLLFYYISRWLSTENTVAHVYNLREGVVLFVEEENVAYAEHFVNS
jgi:hypothetical protein